MNSVAQRIELTREELRELRIIAIRAGIPLPRLIALELRKILARELAEGKIAA